MFSFPMTFPNIVSEVIQKSAVEIKPLLLSIVVNRNPKTFKVCYNHGHDWGSVFINPVQEQKHAPWN